MPSLKAPVLVVVVLLVQIYYVAIKLLHAHKVEIIRSKPPTVPVFMALTNATIVLFAHMP